MVLGGGQTGAETAELLALSGKKVTVVEMLEDIAMNVPPDAQFWVKQSLVEPGVRVLTSTRIKEIGENSVTLIRNGGGNGLVWSATLEPVDTVVLAAGIQPERSLADEITGLVPEVYIIGDASVPSNAMEAVHQAAEVARKI